MSIPTQYLHSVRNAADIVRAVERAVADHALAPGDPLPTVRLLAERLDVSPSTVAAAYRTLATRGIVTGRGRQGTRVNAGPALPARAAPPVPTGVRNLAAGNPSSALLPAIRPALRRLAVPAVTYGDALVDLVELTERARSQFRADGIPADRVVVLGGALDGVERVLLAHLRAGDRVAVEDPGFPRVFDLVGALGLVPRPVTIDDRGMVPDALTAALRDGARAVVLTPRAQNPTGAAMDTRRAAELRRVIRAQPDLLVIEDDHAGPVAGAEVHSLATRDRNRWAVVRSVAKSLGPDLRVAVLVGDATTVDRVEGRLRLGAGWVSHLLQGLVVELWSDAKTEATIATAATTYARRRTALIDALATRGIAAHGRSGLNVWVPVTEEDVAIGGLLARGWAVAGGERFRIASPPAIRVTIADLPAADAARFAADLAATLDPHRPQVLS